MATTGGRVAIFWAGVPPHCAGALLRAEIENDCDFGMGSGMAGPRRAAMVRIELSHWVIIVRIVMHAGDEVLDIDSRQGRNGAVFVAMENRV